MRRNETDDTPAALTELMDYIEENTGLLGDENPGGAHFYIGGSKLKVAPDRDCFNYQNHLLERIESDDRLVIDAIHVHSSIARGESYPVLDVTTA